MSVKVAIWPTFHKPDRGDGGIRRVWEAQVKYLPQFDVEVVGHPDEADVLHTHGTAAFNYPPIKPIVNANHGLYWAVHDWPAWAHEANLQVVEAMSRAQFHSAPSHWVANAIRRGMLVYPEVIHHGIETDEWQPVPDFQDYVLWNKARADAVSNPEDMVLLAREMPDVRFVATLYGSGQRPPNVDPIGTMPVGEMRKFVQHAGLYLATARETFGIGTLEALSCGVPVVGWDWGGQSEIIRHGETGFLADPHDYKALAEGVKWAFANREILAANARQDAIDRWGWEGRIEQYAQLFERARDWKASQEVRVSVIVTCHNLARYLGDCLDSVAAQDFKDWECIVVDDASEDKPDQVAGAYDSRFRFVRSDQNLKLPGARNRGFQLSRGQYVLFLDADDMLAPGALSTLSDQLDKDGSIHIAYGHLDTVNDKGEDRKRNSWPWADYNWRGQLAHLNQLPYAAMMRREVIERAGGYRKRHWRAEDAPLWILATSNGFHAKKVTEAATLIYRNRGDSKSKGEPGDGDWTAWFPYRMGYETHTREASRAAQSVAHPAPYLVPWSAQGTPPPPLRFWPVPDHTEPLVSVIIPVGPGHEGLVIDAVESVRAQAFTDWECVVVNATGERWKSGFGHPTQGAPWAKIIDGHEQLRPAQARNLGAKHARADALLFLDADDILLPDALEEMYSYYLGTQGGLIYTDWLRTDGNPREPMQRYETPEFRCADVLSRMRHAVTCILPRWAHLEIGGFDESLPGWEDWDYFIALQAAGVCSYHVPISGFVYRFREGSIREDSFGKKDAILRQIRGKWTDYYDGRKRMPCSTCPGKAKAKIANQTNPQKLVPQIDKNEPMTLLIYQGPGDGKVNVRGPVTNTMYTFHPSGQRYVMASDAQVLLGRTRKGRADFLLVESRPAPARVRIPVEVLETVAQPDFPEMPGTEIPPIEGMTVRQIQAAAVDADERKLLEWLRQEREGKGRKSAISVLEEALAR